MSSNELQTTVSMAVAVGQVPYVTAMLARADDLLWGGSAGESAPGRAASINSVFRIVSMSKAIGSTAALILADRGKLEWDTPVESILPEFGRLSVLEEIDGAPVVRSPRTKATLRHLTTHTSGLAYEFWDPILGKYLHDNGTPSVVSGEFAGLMYPLRFEPGTRWQYGGGVDWLGMAVAALDGRPIDRFCREEIFEPLGMSSTSFELTPSLHERLGDVFARDEDGSFVPSELTLDPPSRPEFYGMGTALYSTAPDYIRFLRMWLGKGRVDGTRILSSDAVAGALLNQVGSLRFEARATAFPPATADLDLLPGYEKTHGLAFARLEEDIPGRRSAGSQFWGGVLNTHFWIDPAKDLAGVFMTQCVPFLDPEVVAAFAAFEDAAYRAVELAK